MGLRIGFGRRPGEEREPGDPRGAGVPGWAERLVAFLRRLWFGFLLIGLGLIIVVGSLGGAVSEGTPPWVGVVAGAVFLVGGLLFLIHEGGGGGDTAITRSSARVATRSGPGATSACSASAAA